ncbi:MULTISPECIES: ThuA domain-containing protein [unclassified Sphingomonas]|uniref:ThuA domain-containing protein n=1 Tax=unclassified Sphingomonas TaxID=196159 RepID=UPI0002E29ACA|nr:MULTISPECIES: ThuA domain-containing protein [unclassified Sphingomonas]KTF68759.1 hypothetical protein ATB93_12250 [Sphingomonas sp. WG]
MRRLLLALALLLLLPGLARAEPQFEVLVVAAPSTYHYEYIPVARDSLEQLARLHGFGLTWSKDGAPLDGALERYATILFLNTPADSFTPSQRGGLERYMAGGGNAVIVHRAAIVPAGVWPWYEKLIGRSFVNHPMIQTGVVTVLDKGFPAAFGLPDRWLWSDEFYVTANPFDIAIHRVLGVDETSYDPTRIWPGQVGHRMGKDHPLAWYRRHGRSRVFVTLLGHEAVMYRDDRYLQHLLGGIYWTATGKGEQR